MALSPAELIYNELSTYLGPHTAKVALKTFSDRALRLAPENVTRQDAPKLLDALRPMLRTLIGSAQGEALIAKLTRELA